MRTSRKGLVFVLAFTLLSVGIFQITLADHGKDEHRYRNRYREKNRNDGRSTSYFKAINHPVYKDHCGACHFAYSPELLPSASWKKILDQLDDHFGESIELDQQTKKVILGCLETNAAEHSLNKRTAKIVRSLRGQVPKRITEIPYIREKHHEISAATIKRQSIGSLSNCVVCHNTAAEGIFDDHLVVIPE
ncbi:MAG: diheme cytochrome c [Proteobacteria bacterium]|nr:diheme cytochrome c [Pseudomonadota bacterium]